MTKSQNFLRRYLLQGSPDEISKRAAERVAAIVKDTTIKKTEVIRENGFVHGRMLPVARSNKSQ